jgi:uncharacterized protein (TIGR03437 family)
MRALPRMLFAAVAALGVTLAQPSLYAVANSANYDTSAIAQGSLFVMFGSGMGPTGLVQASFPLPPTLAGTSVRVVSGGTSLQCPLVYTSLTQVAAILPSKTPVGQALIFVTYNGQSSGTPDNFFGPFVNVVPSSVGIYTLNSQGNGPGIFTALDGSVTGFAKTVKAGDVVTLWATGVGPIAGDDALPPEAANVPGVEAYVGTQAARVLYAGPSPCCAGLDQISLETPPVVDSCFMPVLVRSGGIVSNVVTLSVSSQHGPCAGAGPAIPSSIYARALNGEDLKVATFAIGPVGFMARVGFDSAQFIATRLSTVLHTPVSKRDAAALLRAIEAHNQSRVRRVMWKYVKQWNALDPKVKKWLLEQANLTRDAASAAFGTLSRSSSLMAIFAGDLPPAGACTIVQHVPSAMSVSSRSLDAGPSLTLNGPAGQVAMAALEGGQYQGLFGASAIGPNVPNGVYTIVGKGGKDVGPFTAGLSIGANLVWTNKTQALDRSQPLTVNWTGGTGPGHVLIGGYQNGGKTFFCAEDASKGAFTVPTVFLSTFKPSSGPVTMFIGQHPFEHQIAIPGLDLAWFIDGSTDSISVPVK